MRILIVENEIYLAQSIASKLADLGFECEIVSLVTEALKDEVYDVVLLSTNLSGQDFYPIIEKYRNTIVILMIAYVSDDTVSKPLKAGAKDYILKPFMIDELVRKIEHFQAFQKLKKEADFYRNYLTFALPNVPSKERLTPPFVLWSNTQKCADSYVMRYIRELSVVPNLIVLNEVGSSWREWLKKGLHKREMSYIIGSESLKKSERGELFEIVAGHLAILSFVSNEEPPYPNIIDIRGIPQEIDLGEEILSLDDYVKSVIVRFEHKYPDTEISKRLGMSRKSLWEKRKRYGISKKK